MRVHLVEDDPTLRSCILSLLGQHGHEVTSADSASSLKYLPSDPDVVILDLNLPDSEGTETLEIAKDLVGDETVIVVYSGHQMWEAECLRLGADDFVLKGDVSSEEILHVIDLAVNQHKLKRAIHDRREVSIGGLLRIDTGKVGDSLISMAQELRALAAG